MATVPAVGSIPSLLSALDSAHQGIGSGVQSFEQVAAAVASQGPSGVSANAMVAALVARNQVSAAARAFEAADQMIGTILDLRA
jgi:hypothetical protein